MGTRCASSTTVELSRPRLRSMHWVSRRGSRTRKTLGSDRIVTMRLLVIDKDCFVQRDGWMSAGWSLLCREAPFERDYLIPAPTGNYGSCKKQELKYAVGSAIQTRVLSILSIGAEPLFRHRVVHCWIPHSGWNFMPSAAGALGNERQVRDLLGSGQHRAARLARRRISALQVTVAKRLQALYEAESHEKLETFMRELGILQLKSKGR